MIQPVRFYSCLYSEGFIDGCFIFFLKTCFALYFWLLTVVSDSWRDKFSHEFFETDFIHHSDFCKLAQRCLMCILKRDVRNVSNHLGKFHGDLLVFTLFAWRVSTRCISVIYHLFLLNKCC